ncbi:MAG: hypothetical protein ACLGIR_08775 [Actinomycetes bacterium]
MVEQPADAERDPFAPIEASPRGATALTVAAFVLAALALFQLPILLGPLGMLCGLVAHVKGARRGFAAAVVAGAATVVGMSLTFLFANPFQ